MHMARMSFNVLYDRPFPPIDDAGQFDGEDIFDSCDVNWLHHSPSHLLLHSCEYFDDG